MTQHHYDAIVIGAGQAGVPLSGALQQTGRKTALIESQYAGGTCINFGCTPTKTMVASGRSAYLARRAAEFGVQVGPVTVDMAQVRQRKRDMVVSFRGGTERRIARGGAEFIRGEARFTGSKQIEVCPDEGGPLELEADTIIINTGARPAVPALEGLESVPALNSTTIMELDVVPERLLVLGGGYIGLEFGQLFRRFGSAVTIVQRGPQLIGREDPDVAEAVAQVLREDGVEVLLDTAALAVAREADGRVGLRVRAPDGERKLTGSHLLVAVGRVPNTERLNLGPAGVETAKGGFVRVNERLETNVPGIYAAGDVKGGPAFTHISYDDFRILRTNLIEGGRATTTDRMVPYVVYVDPQLGRIGLSEQEARAQGRNIRVAKLPMDYISRAWEIGETRGLMKAVVDADTEQILGAAVLGVEGGELMAMLEIAMLGRLSYKVIKDATFAHPSLAEGLNTLFMQLD